MARDPHEQRDYVIQRYPQFWEGFQAMRSAIGKAGPLDTKTQELINTAVYAAAGAEPGTKTHAARAYQAGASPEEVQQAVLLCLGTGLGFSPTYQAVDWVRQALEEAGAEA